MIKKFGDQSCSWRQRSAHGILSRFNGELFVEENVLCSEHSVRKRIFIESFRLRLILYCNTKNVHNLKINIKILHIIYLSVIICFENNPPGVWKECKRCNLVTLVRRPDQFKLFSRPNIEVGCQRSLSP